MTMTLSAHADTFTRDHLPPRELWPEFLPTPPTLRYPQRLNCAVELVDANVAQGHGARRAVVTESGMLNYAELLAAANRIANVLRHDLGLVPGNRVLLRGFNNEVLAAAWLGVVKAGGVVVTTMPLLRAKELREVVELARIDFAICDRRVAADLEAALDGTSLCSRVIYSHDDAPSGLAARMAAHSPEFENVDTAADDVCMIAFTSGTTGHPKGTMHFHRDVLAICDTFPPASFGTRPDDLFTGTPPLAFTFGLGGLLLFPLRAGAATLLIERPSPTALLGAIARFGATITFTAPTSYRAMAALAPQHSLRSLRACVSAGETLPVATRSLWREASGLDIIDGLGSTEMLHVFISAAGDDVRPGATGKAVPGYVARIIDDEGKPLPPGTVGRLAVKGPTGCRYLDDPRQRDYVQDGWNVTGDAYMMDSEGYFWYQGRTDDMIVSSGYNIAAAEVEAVLLEHPCVAECAVVGVPDEARGTIVKAFVVLHALAHSGAPPVATDSAAPRAATDLAAPRAAANSAAPPAAAELQEFVKARIAPYKYPRAIEFVSALPRTETGKLQRFKLRTAKAGA